MSAFTALRAEITCNLCNELICYKSDNDIPFQNESFLTSITLVLGSLISPPLFASPLNAVRTPLHRSTNETIAALPRPRLRKWYFNCERKYLVSTFSHIGDFLCWKSYKRELTLPVSPSSYWVEHRNKPSIDRVSPWRNLKLKRMEWWGKWTERDTHTHLTALPYTNQWWSIMADYSIPSG